MKRMLSALALGLVLLLPRPAGASTFLQFTQLSFTDPFSFIPVGGATLITASNVPIFVVFDPSFCLVPGCGGVTPGIFSLTLTAVSIGPATLVNAGQDINQNYAGSLSITNGPVNLLTIAFTDVFSGSVGGSTPTMAASEPPDLFSGSSTVFDPLKLGIPRGFALSFSDLSPGLSINGAGTISGATADATGTFNATPTTVVPEPATLLLFGTGLLGVGAVLRRSVRS